MMKASPEVAAILRFKAAGIDIELGRLHDLTCPAYHPERRREVPPVRDLATIDVDAFQREAVKAACGPDLARAQVAEQGMAGRVRPQGSRPGAGQRLPHGSPQGVPRRQPRPHLSARHRG